MEVLIKKIHPDAIIPEYKTEGSVGFDLYIIEDYLVAPQAIVYMRTGLVIKVPDGYMLMLVPRSSIPWNFNLTMPHGCGIIDSDYCGDEDEIILQFYNFSNQWVNVPKWTRLAQGILIPVAKAEFVEEEFKFENRGGFGSTGE